MSNQQRFKVEGGSLSIITSGIRNGSPNFQHLRQENFPTIPTIDGCTDFYFNFTELGFENFAMTSRSGSPAFSPCFSTIEVVARALPTI